MPINESILTAIKWRHALHEVEISQSRYECNQPWRRVLSNNANLASSRQSPFSRRRHENPLKSRQMLCTSIMGANGRAAEWNISVAINISLRASTTAANAINSCKGLVDRKFGGTSIRLNIKPMHSGQIFFIQWLQEFIYLVAEKNLETINETNDNVFLLRCIFAKYFLQRLLFSNL